MQEVHYGRKRKGIVKELHKKVDEWIASISDWDVREAVRKDVIVTGGSIASMLLGEKVNDYDIYFRTKETTLLVANYYVKLFQAQSPETLIEVKEQTLQNCKGDDEDRVIIWIQSAGVAGDDDILDADPDGEPVEVASIKLEEIGNEDSSKPPYRPVFLSANAITLSDKIQLVTRFYGEPDQIHENYDFAHAMSYYDYRKNHLELPADALECLLSRTLVYKGSLYPVASIFRTKKFIERGWRISAGEQLKMMWQISELDLTDFATIREQLTGVDATYLWQLTSALKDVDSSKIDSAYVTTIIDKIFG